MSTRALELKDGQRRQLYTSGQLLSYPTMSRCEVIFTEGFLVGERRLLAIRPFQDDQPALISDELDLAQASYHDGSIVAKKGGHDALSPAAIVWVDRATGKSAEILPADEVGWLPTFNERFVVWQDAARDSPRLRPPVRETDRHPRRHRNGETANCEPAGSLRGWTRVAVTRGRPNGVHIDGDPAVQRPATTVRFHAAVLNR